MNLSTLSRDALPARGDAAADATSTDRTAADGTSTSRGAVRARVARWWRGRADDHPAARPALLVLLLLTATLYLVGLGASGWANSFYSAAAQAGSASWKAMFFAASDAAGSITVDKTPMSIWVMALSVRLFGLSSWSILVPQALMGVASVYLLHATVRRTTGNAWAGIVAGLVLALTPVAVLMFRFNNPDALLVLLLVGATAATLRALEDPRRALRWLVLGGALVGFAFLSKMMQAFLVLPALALVYLLAASVPVGRRFLHLLAAFGAMVVAGGWWVLVVELWPASSRPWISGSQDDSVLELALGYNGLGRLDGNETGSIGGGMGWGETGLLRLVDTQVGGQVAWLLPAALLLLVLGLVLSWGRRRADATPWRSQPVTAGLVVWGLWLLVTGLTFSLMAGIFHAYYTVALAPAIGAIIGIGGWVLWQHRTSWVARAGALAVLLATTAMAVVLLRRTPEFLPWLAPSVLGVGVVTAVALLALVLLGRRVPRRWRTRAGAAVAVAALVTMLAGPTAYAVDTARTAHAGAIPSAGPSGGMLPGGFARPAGGRMPQPPAGMTPPGQGQGQGQGQDGQGQGTGFPQNMLPPQAAAGLQGAARGPGGGNVGGLLEGSTSSPAIDALLTEDADSYTWVAATVGSNTAAGYQLSTEEPVMPIGGFNGTDPSPTLEEFQQLVADGEVHWFIPGGLLGRGGMDTDESEGARIQAWVEETFSPTTVDGTTLYDLSDGVR